MPPRSIERIEDQFLGFLEHPRGRRQGRAGALADQFPEQHARAPARSAAAPRAPRSPSPSWRISRRAAAASASSRQPAPRRSQRPPLPPPHRVRSSGHAYSSGVCLRVRLSGPHASVRSRLDQTSARLMDRDFRYAAGFSGSNTLPSKKVSLPRDFEAGMSEAATPSSFAASFQRSSRLTLAISALESKPGLRICPSGCPRS